MKISEMSVELLRSSGTDLDVVNAARVSFAKESEWEYPDDGPNLNAPVLQTKDKKLISYLATHNHWTPFAHVGATFRIKAPIFVARQLVKHQVGLVWNEVSRRYVDDEPEFFFPKWRGKAENVKQGSSGHIEEKFESLQLKEAVELSLNVYNDLLKTVAPEQARMVLPLNTMTEWIWTGSLAAWARVVTLRLDPHAQLEVQEIAQHIDSLLVEVFPYSWKALRT